MKIKLLIPVYNDWESLSKLLKKIDLEIADLNQEFSIIIVNDASTESNPISENSYKYLSSIIPFMIALFSTSSAGDTKLTINRRLPLILPLGYQAGEMRES